MLERYVYTDLQGVNYRGDNLAGYDMNHVNFKDARLIQVLLNGSDLSDGLLKGCDLRDSEIRDRFSESPGQACELQAIES